VKAPIGHGALLSEKPRRPVPDGSKARDRATLFLPSGPQPLPGSPAAAAPRPIGDVTAPDPPAANRRSPAPGGVPSEAARCVCGAVHPLPIERVVIAPSALDELIGFVSARRWSKPFVVMDANTEEVLGARVVRELRNEGLAGGTLSFPERSGLLADEDSVDRLHRALLATDHDSMIAVGSGVVTDVTRFVAGRLGREFVSVPTAASMDGYASSVAAMEFGGMKTTLAAVAPVAIFADPAVVAAAPAELTRSGIGDLLGKATARVDWLLSNGLFGEPYCPIVEARVSEPMTEAARDVREILGQSAGATTALLRGLIESGIAMAMFGNSRPASGCEHHASHFWDLLASSGRRAHAPHGLQVGYATHFAMRLQRWALGGGLGGLRAPRPIEHADELERVFFVNHANEVDAVLEDKRAFTAGHGGHWPRSEAAWQAVRDHAAEAMEVFPLVAGALLTAEIPDQPGFLDLDAATLKMTFHLANRMRARYTVLDLLEGQGRLEEAIGDLLSPAPPPR